MTYHQLRTFLAVARTGSLTRAARELNASQPTVSLQLRALGRSLGTTLVERGDGGLRLTPAGEKVREYAEETLSGLRVLHQDVAALRGRLAGPLAVGITFAMSRYVLAAALSRFREQFPEVDLQLHVHVPEPLFASVLAKTADAVCYLKVRTPPGLTVELLGREELVIIASPRHPLAGRRRVTAGDLSQQPFVAFVSSLFTETLAAKLMDAGVAPRVVAEGRHHDAVKRLVETNAGYSLLVKSSVADELASGRLVALRFDGPAIVSDVVMAYRSPPGTSPLVHEFSRFVRNDLGRRASRRDALAEHVEDRGLTVADGGQTALEGGR
jgi:DNA-binding transcriptional LysR family regulator